MQPHPTPHGYLAMSKEDKIAHWSGYLYRGMRWAGEDGCDEISILDEKEIARLRAADPDIDLLMPYVLLNLARMWMEPIESFVARVNKQMGTHFEVASTLGSAN